MASFVRYNLPNTLAWHPKNENEKKRWRMSNLYFSLRKVINKNVDYEQNTRKNHCEKINLG